ncbi:uncharacterized protein LOC106654741 isoform X3 [Trichogramma pretiosum]|uniref:uncharacterized protein LOC106654741 isoform X3 n=1 Tax=Trichogramma pretiosum TaxID=7493 RepID=UPI000C718997|nr:uncharacterized protein LOC106654741 isoform X3 [Trichogramma pretiosum]
MSQEQDRAAPGQEPKTQPLKRPSIHRLISREEAQTNEDSGNEAQSHEASPANEPRPRVPRARSVQLEGDNQRSRAQQDVVTSSSAEPVTSDDEAILKLRRGSTSEASVESSASSIPETRTRPRNYRTPLVTPHDEAESSLRPILPGTFEYDIDSTQSLPQNLIPEQISNQTARIRQDAEQQSRPSHDRYVSDDNSPERGYQYRWKDRNVHLVPREQIRQDVEQQSRSSHDRYVSDDNSPERGYQYRWKDRNVHLVPREQIRQDVEQQQSRPSHDRYVSEDNQPAGGYQYRWKDRNVHLVPREQIRQDVEQQSRPSHDRYVSEDNQPAGGYQYRWKDRNVHLVPREQIRQDVEQQQARPNHDRPVPDDNPSVQQYEPIGQNAHLVAPEQIRQDVVQARSRNDEHVVPANPRWWNVFFQKLRENWITLLMFVLLVAVLINLAVFIHYGPEELKKSPV